MTPSLMVPQIQSMLHFCGINPFCDSCESGICLVITVISKFIANLLFRLSEWRLSLPMFCICHWQLENVLHDMGERERVVGACNQIEMEQV